MHLDEIERRAKASDPDDSLPFRQGSVRVRAGTLRRLRALYTSGYHPDSVRLHDMAVALGWTDAACLDTVIAYNVLVRIEGPDGFRKTGAELVESVDFSRPRRVRVDGLVLMPLRVPDFMRG